MGFADKVRNLVKKGQDEAATHKDQVHKAVLKAEAAADRQTGGQYHDEIAKAGERADAYVDALNPAKATEAENATAPPGDDPATRPR